MINIAILASGSGTNAEQIIKRFKSDTNKKSEIIVDCLISNRRNAGVVEIARKAEVPCFYFNNASFETGEEVLKFFKDRGIQWIILAGFLRKIPSSIIDAYEDRIINLHPALLPKYGGRGMYGKNVHEAVLEAKEKESGISIHYVNENFDEGGIIFQKSCEVTESDNLESLTKKIQQLEHAYFPQVIEDTVLKAQNESSDSPT